MVQLKTVISPGAGPYCSELLVGERSASSLNPDRPNTGAISAPNFTPQASKPRARFHTGFLKVVLSLRTHNLFKVESKYID